MTEKRVQWIKHGDHPAVRKPGRGDPPHLLPDPALLDVGFLPTPNGEVLVRSGDWIVTDDRGTHRIDQSSS